MDLMFEAYLTYESASQSESDDIPRTKEPVWVLGKKFSALTELDEIRQDIRSRLWFSYRKGFVPIGGSGLTSDKGWGCMLRCGQMVLGQALLFHHLGREWKWSPSVKDKTYLRILRMFEDRKAAPYSIHQIALTGASEGKQVGEWFGPNTVAQVLRKLTVYDKWSFLALHVALDNILITSEVKKLCKYVDENLYEFSRPVMTKRDKWKPLLLIIPLRLGLTEINPVYVPAFKACFTFPQSLGIIGGKPNHALYFIGCVGDDAIFLDPHTTQPAGYVKNKDTEQECKVDASYHCQHANRLHILQMDPSVALCFLCRTEMEFDDLCHLFKTSLKSAENRPLFEVYEDRSHIWGLSKVNYKIGSTSHVSDDLDQFDDSDDDFEIIG